MSVLIGIDSGAHGAVAFMDRATGAVVGIQDMPVDVVQVGESKTRLRVSAWRILSMLSGCPDGQGHVFIERPEGRPVFSRNKQNGVVEQRSPGAAGMLSMGESYGIVLCAIVANKLAVTEIRPRSWKGALGVPAAKDDARRMAIQLYPAVAQHFARKKDDGRAEAVLIARYARWKLDGVMS